MKDKLFYNKTLTIAKKLNLITKHGGCCSNCGESRHWVLEFHHEGDKEFGVGSLLGGRLSKAKKESEKCILLCSNCHREIHNEYKETTCSRTKIKMLEYKKTKECQYCGYSKLNRTLDFHHKNPDEKLIHISDYRGSIKELTKQIKEELDKCIVLCSNCHKNEHYNLKFFEDNREYILEKSQNIKELQPALDKEEVKKLFESGMSSVDIAKKYKASKGTISGILKSFGLTKSLCDIKINRIEFGRLHSLGYNNKQLEFHFKIPKSTVFLLLKELNLKTNKMAADDPNNGNFKTRKFNPTKEELEELLKTKSQRQIGKIYGVSQVAVLNRKRLFGL